MGRMYIYNTKSLIHLKQPLHMNGVVIMSAPILPEAASSASPQGSRTDHIPQKIITHLGASNKNPQGLPILTPPPDSPPGSNSGVHSKNPQRLCKAHPLPQHPTIHPNNGNCNYQRHPRRCAAGGVDTGTHRCHNRRGIPQADETPWKSLLREYWQSQIRPCSHGRPI
jgi:hypothetical protein